MTNYDVVVVGSGAGGGSVAYKLARAGKQVLLIEKGPFLPRDLAHSAGPQPPLPIALAVVETVARTVGLRV